MTVLVMDRDASGAVTYNLQPTDIQAGVTLATSAAQDLITLPSTSSLWQVFFSYTPGANVFVNINGTAEPFPSTAGPVDSELNPAGRVYKAGTVISVITPDTIGAYVGILAYAKAT